MTPPSPSRASDQELSDLRAGVERLLADENASGTRWDRMAGLGWLSLVVPEERGGAGAGPEAAALAAALREWERPDATSADRSAAASSAKARAATAARHVTTTAVHLHGALGFSDEYVLGRYVNRALVLSAFLGDAAAHRRRHHALTAGPDPDERHRRAVSPPEGAARPDEAAPAEDEPVPAAATELTRRIADAICDAAGPAGAVREPVDVGGEPFEVLDVFYKALPSTIYGGSNDVQRDVVAKRVLRLPATPDPRR